MDSVTAPKLTAAVDEPYEPAGNTVLAAVATAADWVTAGRVAHPWFGPCDAAAGGHLGMHRAQVAAITTGLPQ